ncbi:hypothetical protein OESDEN_20801 [Oesophagostomum dentatum]|uniref:Uncharacterized protein n=1 Tax=Oesophagostomum dentatum TaxID=61180 RepID=A0A0B1S8J8_OESDE|nr:hypothetical protein OESDEN_20801 [Oesophagostomum dentatum]
MSSALLLILCILNIARTMSEPTEKSPLCSRPGATVQVPSKRERELLVEIFKRENPKAMYSKHQMEKYAVAVLNGQPLRSHGLTTAYYNTTTPRVFEIPTVFQRALIGWNNETLLHNVRDTFMGYSGVLTVSPTTSVIALPGTNTNLNAFFTRNKRNGF